MYKKQGVLIQGTYNYSTSKLFILFFQVEKELTATNSRQIEKNKGNLVFKNSFYETLSSSLSRIHVVCFKSTGIFILEVGMIKKTDA